MGRHICAIQTLTLVKLSVLIPYRPDTEYRERLNAVTSRLWRATGAEVIYASDGLTGPFSFSKAINAARRAASGDCFLSYSVDALPPSPDTLARLASRLHAGTPWVAGWRGQIRYSGPQTDLILAGAPASAVGEPIGGISLGREALVAVRADVWDELRGYDERFLGWGPEDKAWHFALKTLYPDGEDQPTEGLFRTLWHPTTPRTLLKKNVELFREYHQHKADFRHWYFSR